MTPIDTRIAALALLPPAERAQMIASLGAERVLTDWPSWAQPGQRPPAGAWRTWLLLAGRGYGKTRAGAEWVRGLAEADGTLRIALVSATLAEARSIMVEGESGLLAIAPRGKRPRWEASKNRLVWRNGAQAMLYSGESPDGLRGPQHHFAWCDELAKWAYGQATWDNLQMGLRLGGQPRAVVTTTPRPLALVRALIADPGVIVTRGTMRDNHFLSPAFVASMQGAYGGTRLGRQELDGELITDTPGALWTRDRLDVCRVRTCPELRRIVVAVDPPAGIGRDACGVVVAGLIADGRSQGEPVWATRRAIVIEDASVHGATPEGWARAVADAVARHKADRVVAESNQGGVMVASVLRAAGLALPVKLVHATRGKVARAEPVAALYEAGRISHLGSFPELEDELCGLMTGGGYTPGNASRGSPDRADALVYALTELLLGATDPVARVRQF